MATPLGGSKVPRLSLGALQTRNREDDGPPASSLGLVGTSSKIPLPQSARAPAQGREQEGQRHQLQRPPLTARGRPPLAAQVQFPVPAAGNSRDPTPRLLASQPQKQQPRLPPASARGPRPPASGNGVARAGPSVLPTTPRNTYRDALVTPCGSQGAGTLVRAVATAAAEPGAPSSSRSGLHATRGRSTSPLGRQQQEGDAVMASSSLADVATSLRAPSSHGSLGPHQEVPKQQQPQQQQDEGHNRPPPVMVTHTGSESPAEHAVEMQPGQHHSHHHRQQEGEQQQQQQQRDPQSEASVLQNQQEAEQLQAALNSHQAELQQRLSAIAGLSQQRSALAAQVAAAQQLCMQARQREEARRAQLQDLDLASRTLAATLENYKLQAVASHTSQARLELLHLMLAAARLAGTPVVAAAVEQEMESTAASASNGRSQLVRAPAEVQRTVGGSGASVPYAPLSDTGRDQAATPVGGVGAHSSDSSSGGYEAATPADSDTSTSSSSSYGCSSGSEESCSTADSRPGKPDDCRHNEVTIYAHADCASSRALGLPPLMVVPALQLCKGLSLGGASPRIATLREGTAAAPPAAAGPVAPPSAQGPLTQGVTGGTAAAVPAPAPAAVPCAGAGMAARATARAPAKLLLPGSPCLMTAAEAVGAATPTGAGLACGGGEGLRSPLSPLAMQRLQSIRRKFEAAECIMAAVVEQNVVL